MPDNHSASAPAAPNEIRESTCIHTKKIYDSCQAKDCVEDLRLYPLLSCQSTIDSAMSLRAGRAELLHVYMDVQPVGLGRGYYAVDLRFFYKVTAEATAGCARSALVTGLAIFDKRSMLFGSEGRAKRFTSDCACQQLYEPCRAGVCHAGRQLVLRAGYERQRPLFVEPESGRKDGLDCVIKCAEIALFHKRSKAKLAVRQNRRAVERALDGLES